MRTVLSYRHVWWFALAYLGSIGVLIAGGRPLEDVLGALLILGVLLPLVASAACARMPAPQPPAPWRHDDRALLLGLLAWIVVFLILKGPLLNALLPSAPDPRLQETINALLKLFAFVVVPAFVLRSRGFRWSDAGRPSASTPRLWLAFIVMAFAAFAVQAVMGSQFKRLLGTDYAGHHLWLAGVLCWAWMSIEAGLVEEFFFRWYLQSRLAAWTGSQASAVLLGALVFGLAHAPGILLRGAGAVEGLGEEPGIGTALAYVIATQGVAGLAFGVLWTRTRSFVLVVALHGLFDAFSNTAPFIDTWRL
jgi:membrane protease YdiL (CAAX protease family)